MSMQGYMIATEPYKPEAVQPACESGIFSLGLEKSALSC
jgi:hypothetical protein